jgi:hypothetical protein
VQEQDWLSSTDPQGMLEFLRTSGKADDRKLRLFACACCRRVWHLVNDERSRRAVEVAERWADGRATPPELMAAHQAAWEAWGTPARTAASDATAVAWEVGHAADAGSHAAWAGTGGSRADERKAQADLLRCILGDPFRPPPLIEPGWLRWNGGTLVRLATVIYDERRFEDMPVLTDALEEAGCADEAILSHGRDGGPHCRGCWLVDALLGKE